jgi:subtilisin family serine protease
VSVAPAHVYRSGFFSYGLPMSRVLPGLVSVLLLLGLLQPGWLQPLPGRSLSAPTPAAAPAVALTTSPQPLAGASLLPPAASPAEPVHVAQFAFNEHVVVHTAPSAERAREFLALAAQRRQGRGALALVGLREIPLPARRTTWRGHGIDLLRYVPDRGWIARLDADQIVDPAATLAWAAQEVTALSAFDPDLRIDPRLRAAAGPDDVPLYVHAAADADLEQTRRDLLQQGFPLGPGPGYLAGRLDPALLAPALAALGRHPDVQFVERGSGAHLLNTPSAKILQSGSYTGALPIYAQGVYGSNQIIAVLDTGIDADSCYFRDAGTGRPPTNFPGGTTVDLTRRKVIACDFWKPGDNPGNVAHWDDLFHGTRVAGHAAGSDLSFPVGTNQHNGMAPGAWLVVQDAGYLVDACGDIPGMGCPVTNFLPALQQAYAQGARIHNNSWGDNENAGMGTQNLYSAVSAELDAMAWSNRDFLIVCAAGNSSLTNIVGSPSTAKNGLSVAAGQAGANAHLIAGFSSRGWTRDGRIKPDLTAPGQSVTSANNDGNITTFNCTTSTGDGTSYASPMVCGLAALVRDYFARGYYPGGVPAPADARTNISAALVKAVLLNGCVDMSGAVARPPARDQGWGPAQPLARAGLHERGLPAACGGSRPGVHGDPGAARGARVSCDRHRATGTGDAGLDRLSRHARRGQAVGQRSRPVGTDAGRRVPRQCAEQRGVAHRPRLRPQQQRGTGGAARGLHWTGGGVGVGACDPAGHAGLRAGGDRRADQPDR